MRPYNPEPAAVVSVTAAGETHIAADFRAAILLLRSLPDDGPAVIVNKKGEVVSYYKTGRHLGPPDHQHP